VSPAYAKWIDDVQFDGAGNIGSWTDRSGTTTPARWAYDGYVGYPSEKSGTDDDVWYFCLDLGSAVAFDCAFILGHNLGTLNLGNDVLLQISDDSGFNTSLTTIGNFGTPAANDDSRLYDISLAHGADGGRAHDTGADAGPNRYTAQYVCVTIDKTGTNISPEIGELVLGRSYQLEYKAQRPFDDYFLSEEFVSQRTQGGVYHKTVYNRRGYELSADLITDSTTYESDLVAFFRQCRGPFVYIENPNSAPESFRFMMREGAFEYPRVEAGMRQYHLAAVEQGPEEYFLDVEANG